VIIHGGLAIPWYFLMLAVMGAGVSMARRVPEYQRRVQLSSNDKESLSPSLAREQLVFQVLQVGSAPLIAITAYNALTPGSRAVSVALAFVSGFSSESVLLAIRALADKISPKQEEAQPRVTNGQAPSGGQPDVEASAAKAMADGNQSKLAALGDDPVKQLRDVLAAAPPNVAASLSGDLKAAETAFENAKNAAAASQTHARDAEAAAKEAAASSKDPTKLKDATARAQKASDDATKDSHDFEQAMAAFKAADEKIAAATAKG
jgi:hypothetical protein